MKIEEKVAVVEVSLSIEDFLEQWGDMEEPGEPTQADYDAFLEGVMREYLQREGDCSRVTLKGFPQKLAH